MDLQNVQILNKVIVVIDFYLNSRIFPAVFILNEFFPIFWSTKLYIRCLYGMVLVHHRNMCTPVCLFISI